MAGISTYFYRMPTKLARRFAKLIGGSVEWARRTSVWVATEDENAPIGIHITIEFYLDTPENIRNLNLESKTMVMVDEGAGMRIYRSTKRSAWEPFYIVLVRDTPTPLQAYKAYLLCVKLSYESFHAEVNS